MYAWTLRGFDIGIRPSWELAMEDVRRAGGKPFPIPAGCSEHPLGGLGFVGFADEVRAQETELGFKFDYIVVCSVTGSTQAGMVVGFAADGRADRVIGIDASATPAKTRAQILRIAQNTAKLVELGREISEQDVVLDTRYGGPAYGLPNEGTMEAIRLCARQEGVLTDPVYEGKSMHGMIDMVRAGRVSAGLQSAVRPPRRRAGTECLQLPVPQRLKAWSRTSQLPAWFHFARSCSAPG